MVVLGQRESDTLRDPALDLAANLSGIDDDPGVDGLHAVENADLPGDAVHRDPEPLRVGCDTARRAVRLAGHRESETSPSRRLNDRGSGTGAYRDNQAAVVQGAIGYRDADVCRCALKESHRAARPMPASRRYRIQTGRHWRRRRCRSRGGRCRTARGGSAAVSCAADRRRSAHARLTFH